MKNTRILIFSIIIIVCVLAIGIIIYVYATEKDYNESIKKSSEENSFSEDEITLIKNNFDNIFKNDIEGNNEDIEKRYEQQEVVYTAAQKVEIIPTKYDLNVQIPQFNFDNVDIQKCNSEIKQLFQNKASDILTNVDVYTMYSVKYHVFVNNNIISLIIKSNLKEGTNPEREIIKTYNYDINEKKILSITDIIEKFSFNKNEVQEKISSEINKQKGYQKSMEDLGYTVYQRDINSQMYRLENVNNFIIGKNGHLYIIYAYGNSNYTSEMDLIII